MKKQKKCLLLQIVIFLIVVLFSCKVFATDNMETIEFSEDYKKYLELSDEEKEKVIAPRMYNIPKTTRVVTNPLKLAKLLGATVDTTYSLKEVIPANMVIKDQKQTNSCWAFSSMGMLESTLALNDYKNGKSPIVYDFSERHMEYATSYTFKDGVNKNGFNRKVGAGGIYKFALAYLTNGMGAISENEMPFENNTDLIELSKIENVNVKTQVKNTIDFPSYESTEDTTTIKQQVKEHIKNYGGVFATIYTSSSLTQSDCYNNKTGAIYCDDSTKYNVNHGVLIIGWDDNYSKDNFLESKSPKNDGAWIIKNSWGTEIKRYTLEQMKEAIIKQLPETCSKYGWTSAEDIPDDDAKRIFQNNGYTIENDQAVMKVGDDGFMYISYEDVNIYKGLEGITDAEYGIDYENIYQYDQYGGLAPIELNEDSKVYLGTVFDKQTQGKEYLTQVSINAPETYTCKVYVNPNGTSKSKSDLKQVQLKTGETETVEAGYHTIEFLNPIQITGDKFVVVIEVQGTQTDKISVMAEFNYGEFYGNNVNTSSMGHAWDNVTTETGKCFITFEDKINNNVWTDTATVNTTNEKIPNYYTTIKAFTTSKINATVLEGIEITTSPSKTSYKVGEDFDKTGMVVKAKYSDGTSKEITDYTIKDGINLTEGKANVTIEYQGKTAQFEVEVKEDGNNGINSGSNGNVAKPQNSNFDAMQGNVTRMRAYYFSDASKKEYTIISMDINDITFANGNDKMEYYYYLSANPKETSIKDWVKINKFETKDNKLSFEINTADTSNYEEISSADTLYLYIKEVATLNNIQEEKTTPSLELEVENISIEEYIDGKKVADVDSDTIVNPTPGEEMDDYENGEDETLSEDEFPNAGKGMMIVGLILGLIVVGRMVYIRYKDIEIK